MASHVGRNALAVGLAEGRQAAAGLDEQAVGVPVVAALELDDSVSAGDASGEPQRRHAGLRAARHHPKHLDAGIETLNRGGELDLSGGRRAEGHPLGGCGTDRGDDLLVGVPEQGWAPAPDVVDVNVAVDIREIGALRARDERRVPAHRSEGADRAVDPARHELLGSSHQLAGVLEVSGHFVLRLGLRGR